MHTNPNHPCRLPYKVILSLVLLIAALSPNPAMAQRDFSFLVLGHTKTFYYLPGGREQDKDIRRMISRRFPGRKVELFYGPMGVELQRLELGPGRGEPRTDIRFEQGWPIRAVQWIQGKPKVVMRASGQEWVYGRVIENLWRGARSLFDGPLFGVHAGEAVMWGGQGKTASQSPYWQRFKSRLLDRLPPPDRELGMPTRLFMAPGVGEGFEDPGLSGLLSALPGLSKTGFSSQRRIYNFGYQGVRFIFLDSGNASGAKTWDSCCPGYAEQMRLLEKWLEKAVADQYRLAFIFVNRPPFCLAAKGLGKTNNLHQVLAKYAGRMELCVISGGVATTELYEKENIRYIVLGGGGGVQRLFSRPPVAGQPEERYWKNRQRKEEYNYLVVSIQGGRPRFLLHRFRPTSVNAPYEQTELFK
jgi:hypothetical protein